MGGHGLGEGGWGYQRLSKIDSSTIQKARKGENPLKDTHDLECMYRFFSQKLTFISGSVHTFRYSSFAPNYEQLKILGETFFLSKTAAQNSKTGL